MPEPAGEAKRKPSAPSAGTVPRLTVTCRYCGSSFVLNEDSDPTAGSATVVEALATAKVKPTAEPNPPEANKL
jgi:hypothetical protein